MPTDPSDIQLLLLSGLGSDGRIFYRQRTLPYKLITPNYIDFEQGEPLTKYSKRLSDHILLSGAIRTDRPLIIGGLSLGGAIAQEMSNHIRCDGVIASGTIRDSKQLRPYIRFFGKNIASKLPLWVYHANIPLVPIVMSRVSRISDEDVKLCTEMYRAITKHFFREGYRAITEWEGCNVTKPMLRIHGRDDQIIPFPNHDKIDVPIDGGKHLVGLSHYSIVNLAIIEFISSLEL